MPREVPDEVRTFGPGGVVQLRYDPSSSGAEPFELDDGSVRTFLEDGDEVTITATAPAPSGSRIALGEVSGRILPVKEHP
ncbi:hypothetical protein ABTZ46_02360 [Nocardioides sp. NPDC126508]